MAKSTPSYVLNLKLITQPYEEDILNKRFGIGRKLYNAILGQALNRYKEMIKTKIWRDNQSNLANIYKSFKTISSKKDKTEFNKLCRPYYNIKNDMLKEFRLNEYSLHEDVKPMQHHFKNNIDSFTAQKIASRVWTSLNDNLFGKGEEVHFKGINKPLNSLEGKTNGTGIKYDLKSNLLIWNGLKIATMLDINNQYEITALRDRVKYCRIKRRFVRGKYKYILQLILEGIPPVKVNKETGEIKGSNGIGVCGIDIGTQTVAYVSNYDCKLYELAPRVQNIEDEKRRIQRYMDRSKRATNPNNFDEDGTIKRGVKLEWNFSNRYIKVRNKLKDLYRKQADIRREDHNIMVNEIISQCNIVKVEEMNFKSLQKRSKNTEKNDKGKFKRKKRFGKSLANKSPSMFLTILENKLKEKGGLYIQVNTYKIKASQYNHLNQEYNKKKLSQRWNYFEYNGKQIKVQRDIYSAYLIKNVMENKETIDNEKCIKDFNKFLEFHNIEISRLQGFKNLSSMGI